jgi:hypothetical protein
VTAEETGLYESYLEEVCLTYDLALSSDKSLLVVMKLLDIQEVTLFAKDITPLAAVESAIAEAITQHKKR